MNANRSGPAAKSDFPIWIIGLIGCLVAVPVVVAVIGILAAIAIPNFIKFQCKSKQSEARTVLSQIHAAEMAFFAEHGFYTSDLAALGVMPYGTPAYLYGFAEPGPDRLPPGASPPQDLDPERKDTADPAAIGGSYSTSKMRDLYGMPLSARDFPLQAVVTETGFTAAAIGDIDSDYQTTLDVWTIDENRQLKVLSNDCTN